MEKQVNFVNMEKSNIGEKEFNFPIFIFYVIYLGTLYSKYLFFYYLN